MTSQRLGNYLIESELGRGGVATVWRARHRFLGTTHALKVLSRPSPKGLTRLLREGRVQAQLQHPHIVPVTDIVVDDERVALAMPLITGGTLEGLVLARGALPHGEALALFRPVIEAIVHAHRAGVLHRDLKPQNVLIDHGQPRVTDFGIARLLRDDDDPDITKVGAPMGTLGFCSPEQWANASDVDERSDVFSLGAMLFWLLTARAPFDEDSPTNTLRNTLTGRHPDLRRLVPTCPEHVVAAVHRALLPKPEARQASALALAEQLGLELEEQRPAALVPGERLPVERQVVEAARAARQRSLPATVEAPLASEQPRSMPLLDAPPAMGVLQAAARAHSQRPPPPPPPALEPPELEAELDALSEEGTDDEATLRSASRAPTAPGPAAAQATATAAGGDTFLDDAPSLQLPVATPGPALPRAFLAAAGALVALAGGALLLSAAQPPAPAPAPTVVAEPVTEVEAPPPPAEAASEPEGTPAVLEPAEAPAVRTASVVPGGRSAAPEAVADARCPRSGSAALGWWEVDRRAVPEVGDRVRVRRAAPVIAGRLAGSTVSLGSSTTCRLDRGQRVEVRSAPVTQTDGTVLVEVFPAAISGG